MFFSHFDGSNNIFADCMFKICEQIMNKEREIKRESGRKQKKYILFEKKIMKGEREREKKEREREKSRENKDKEIRKKI